MFLRAACRKSCPNAQFSLTLRHCHSSGGPEQAPDFAGIERTSNLGHRSLGSPTTTCLTCHHSSVSPAWDTARPIASFSEFSQ